jgi:predicted RNA methylase
MRATGLRRNGSDKFYTCAALAERCVSLAAERLAITPADLLVEPSAGAGVFIPYMRALSPHTRFFDIAPAHPDVMARDFLEDGPGLVDSAGGYAKVHVIGNPPFGRQASLAVRFIQKSCEFCDSVSFILPRSFKKDSLRNRVPAQFRLDTEIELPQHSFTINDQPHSVKCVFQIWVRDIHLRVRAPEMAPVKFEFVRQTEFPHATVRRVGARAGEVKAVVSGVAAKCAQSHYFIKFTNGIAPHDNILRLAHITFTHDNTVGPRSISKPELIAKFDPAL